MTTLIAIPDCKALHLPARGVAPVPLAQGDLTLTLLPASPPQRKEDAVTLSVGTSTFVLSKLYPMQRTRSTSEHPSFIFTPAPPENGQSIGQVRIDIPDSTSPEHWERMEEACRALESELRAHGVWEEKILYVNDEYETDGPITGPQAGWGDSVATTIMGGAGWLASRISGKPAQSILPTTNAGSSSYARRNAPASEGEEIDMRSMAADTWTQATIAAKGLGSAAYAVGGAIGQQARSAVEGLQQHQQHAAPAPPSKDAPAPPAKDSTSPTSAAPSAPAASSAPAVEEQHAQTTAEVPQKEREMVPA